MEQTLGLWRARMSPSVKLTIAIVLFPGFTQLDVTGPHEFLARLPNAEITLVAITKDVVTSERGLKLIPDKAFSECTSFDILLVPGGPAIDPLLNDRGYVEFVQRIAGTAKYIVSVCTGALLLGAAGLLRGYKATTHWLSLEFLSAFGATPVRERVVVDRNRITTAGVTAGIDMSLWLAGQLYGPQIAKTIQLIVQYQPAPLFPNSGAPETADAEIVAHIHDGRKEAQAKRREAVLNAATKFASG